MMMNTVTSSMHTHTALLFFLPSCPFAAVVHYHSLPHTLCTALHFYYSLYPLAMMRFSFSDTCCLLSSAAARCVLLLLLYLFYSTARENG